MPRYKGNSYEDQDYEPDTDGPDTSESDSMIEAGINGSDAGIGKISSLKTAGQDLKKYQDYRAQAAKQMMRKPESEPDAEMED